MNEISHCLSYASQYQLGELVEYIIAKLKTAKLSDEQFKLFHATLVRTI